MPLLAIAAAAPAVSVSAEPNDGSLDEIRRWVALRVLQEGYDLAPGPETADGVVVVRARGEGLEVEASGARGQRRHAVERGPTAIRRLEVLHRALMGIEATVAEPGAPRPPALALDASPGTDALVGAIVSAALGDGIRVTSRPGPDDVLMCVEARGDLAEVGTGPAEAGCAPPTVVVSLVEELEGGAHDLVVQAEPALRPSVDPVETEPPAPIEPIEPEPIGAGEDSIEPTPTVVADAELVPMQGPPRAELRLGVDGGALARGRAVDASMRAHVRLGAYHGFGGCLELGVIPAAADLISVVDTVLAVGPDWQASFGRRGRFRVGATVGADIHSYAVATTRAADVGWVTGLPVELSYALSGDTRIHFAALSAISGVATSHRLGDEVVWRRAAWRVGAAIGFSYGWRVE